MKLIEKTIRCPCDSPWELSASKVEVVLPYLVILKKEIQAGKVSIQQRDITPVDVFRL